MAIFNSYFDITRGCNGKSPFFLVKSPTLSKVKSPLLEPELQLLEGQRRARGRVHLFPEVRPAVYAKNPQKMLISGTKIGTYPLVMSK